MTSPLAPVPATDSERVEPPFPPGPVEELMRAFARAARAHQLYLPNNPIYKGALDGLRAAFAPLWAQTEELVLAFTETQVVWEELPVLEETGKSSDSLPWLFYKDGVRELKLLHGIETEEIVRLLEIVQRVRKASPDEDDLLTLLWEADFVFLRYRYVDLGMEPASPVADGTEVEPHSPEEVRTAASEAVEESRASGIVSMADFDGTLYFLDENEIDYLQGEVKREYAQDLRANVVAILLDIFERQDPSVRDEVCEHLETLLVHMLAAGAFRTVAMLLREAQTAMQRAPNIQPAQRQRLADLSARLSAPEALAQMLQSLDESPDLPPQSDLVELFQQLRPSALATIFGWLGRTQNARLKPLLEEAAGRLASTSTAELVRLIGVHERDVAAEAIRRSGALRTPAAVGALGKILGSNDRGLRLLAVQALAEIGSPGALKELERGVDDSDRDVRIAAVRALATRAYRPVLLRLEVAVKGKAIREADLTEKMAFFEGYGSLCGDSGVVPLDALLNGKGFLGRREESELRACAAMALGRIGSAAATEALRKAQGEKDVVVRNAVNRALRGAST